MIEQNHEMIAAEHLTQAMRNMGKARLSLLRADFPGPDVMNALQVVEELIETVRNTLRFKEGPQGAASSSDGGHSPGSGPPRHP